eukprot:CAMPEP_0170515756 /NCGR_PEP_ID=MMETSP0209-20121228/2146_1 /TAXON_ID=665100 ORGANISM="Litonotus pictus, Strain P1" /NCGR_SAMPLE_ID=MMETSP0209 /ASSEMBLY_ACC=CAM_ASM_000301 /LENGTH=415 /DNA_ID=CAMNT_0010800387 /DNA_START=251 /DNA_END=1498 /DNA_ORIENTATION=-
MKPLMHSVKKRPFSEIEDSLTQVYGDYHKIFKDIDPEPLGTASLAQVHKATLQSGETVAIKVQHKRLLPESKGDIFLIKQATAIGEYLFTDFKYKWLGYQFETNLLKELDFRREGKNADRLRNIFDYNKQIVVPKIYWDVTTEKILVMDFEEGGSIQDPQYLKDNNIDVRQVARLLTETFNLQIFKYGFVHADPHQGNIFIRKSKKSGDILEMVILDHGLYKELDEEFRYFYSNFWRGVITQNRGLVAESCKNLNISSYELFVSIVLSRKFDEVMSDEKKYSTEKRFSELKSQEEKDEVKQYAQMYHKDITQILSGVREEMPLLLKINEFLRAIDRKLGSPLNNFEIMMEIIYDELPKNSLYKKKENSLLWLNMEFYFYQIMFKASRFILWFGNLFSKNKANKYEVFAAEVNENI